MVWAPKRLLHRAVGGCEKNVFARSATRPPPWLRNQRFCLRRSAAVCARGFGRTTLWTKAAQPGSCPQKNDPAAGCPRLQHTGRGVQRTCIAAAQVAETQKQMPVVHRKRKHLLLPLCIHRSLKGTTTPSFNSAQGRTALCARTRTHMHLRKPFCRKRARSRR